MIKGYGPKNAASAADTTGQWLCGRLVALREKQRVQVAAQGRDLHPDSRVSALFHGTQQFIGPPRDGLRQEAVPLREIV